MHTWIRKCTQKNELRQICKNARHTLGVTQAYAGSYACAFRGVYVAQARILFGPGDAHAQAEIRFGPGDVHRQVET